MLRDPLTGELFLRVVGRRTASPIGAEPPAATRQALTAMAGYRTAAPKGVFIYRSHEEMDADRLRWTVDAVVEQHRDG